IYALPSTSQIFEPAARSTKNGSRPKPRKARTGELTPPGMRASARANRSDEYELIGVMEYWSSGVLIQSPPLHYSITPLLQLGPGPSLTARLLAFTLRFAKRWRGSQVVRSGSAKPLFAGSIPAPASFVRRGFPEQRDLWFTCRFD